LPAPTASVTSLSYDAAHEVAGAGYDAMGRLTSDAQRNYSWDLRSRLTSYTTAEGTVSSTYDAFGMRTSVTTASGTSSHVWNYATGLPSLAVVRNADGDQRYYIYTPGGSLLHAIDGDNTRHFYHFDQIGSAVLLTDDSAAVTDSYGTTPYGESVSHT